MGTYILERRNTPGGHDHGRSHWLARRPECWCGVQLQRGRQLLGQVENMERMARKKRTAKEQDPMLKRARAKVAKWAEEEEEARLHLKEARAK